MSVSVDVSVVFGLIFAGLAAVNVSRKKYGWATWHALITIFYFIYAGVN